MSQSPEVKEASEKAIAVLAAIAGDERANPETRIRAALGILGHAESVRQGVAANS